MNLNTKNSILLDAAKMRLIGHAGYVCPWCNSSTVKEVKSTDGTNLWIYVPCLIKEPKIRCEACWWIIDTTCRNLEFGNSLDLDWVQRAAKIESSSIFSFRLSLLRQALIDIDCLYGLTKSQKDSALKDVRNALHSIGY